MKVDPNLQSIANAQSDASKTRRLPVRKKANSREQGTQVDGAAPDPIRCNFPRNLPRCSS